MPSTCFGMKHYGAPEFFVCDEGNEQCGDKMRELLTFYDVRGHVIAGQAPWQNSTAERHGYTLKNMIKKVLGESTKPIEEIVTQCVVAKNDMGRYHGHSPAEWAQGRKRKLPLDLLQTEEPLGARVATSRSSLAWSVQ